MSYTHIKIESIPQPLDARFDLNMRLAEQQKALALAAPELLEALDALIDEYSTRVASMRIGSPRRILWGKAFCIAAKAKGE